MAWISVHEQVLGGKLRELAKELDCSQNESLGLLVRLWLWGINNADKEGRIIGATKADVAEVLSIGLGKTLTPEDAVDALIKTNWIDLEGDLYLHDWDEWQEQWYKAIKAREDAADRKRRERARKRAESTSEKKVESNLPVPKLIIPHGEAVQRKTEEPKKPTEPKKPPEEYSEGFLKFWNAYPRKVGKGEAFKKYKTRVKAGWSPEELYEAAVNYAAKVTREKTEMQYIKHPSTFLSDTEPFTDYLPKKQEPRQMASGENEENPYADWR